MHPDEMPAVVKPSAMCISYAICKDDRVIQHGLYSAVHAICRAFRSAHQHGYEFHSVDVTDPKDDNGVSLGLYNVRVEFREVMS